jgi:hypothetical protein
MGGWDDIVGYLIIQSIVIIQVIYIYIKLSQVVLIRNALGCLVLLDVVKYRYK